jgi:hypothetical protein
VKIRFIALAIVVSATCQALTDDQKKSYKETNVKVLRLDPKAYKNDRVAVTGRYLGAVVNFHNYVEESGFDSDRYLAFSVDSPSVPIFARKKGDVVAQIAALKKGTKITVFGRLKEFRKDPKDGRLPKYYVEFEHLEAEMPAVDVGLGGAEPNGNDRAVGAAPRRERAKQRLEGRRKR